MNKHDFLKLIGADKAAEYVPVACLLRSGYGWAGHFSGAMNQDLDSTCVLVNARLVALRESQSGRQASIEDFNEFLEEVVKRVYSGIQNADDFGDEYGKTIPLAAVPLNEISVVYPVAHIGAMMRAVQGEGARPPAFLDFQNRSIVLKVLRTKLW